MKVWAWSWFNLFFHIIKEIEPAKWYALAHLWSILICVFTMCVKCLNQSVIPWTASLKVRPFESGLVHIDCKSAWSNSLIQPPCSDQLGPGQINFINSWAPNVLHPFIVVTRLGKGKGHTKSNHLFCNCWFSHYFYHQLICIISVY